MNEAERAEVDVVVGPGGDVAIPSDAIRRLALVPGQRVVVSVTPRPLRRNMHGALAGRLSDIDQEGFRRVRREIWGDLASGS